MPAPAGYHFKAGPEGMLAIETDVPYPGAVTVSWRPTAANEAKATAIIPAAIFAHCAVSYVKKLATSTNAEKAS